MALAQRTQAAGPRSSVARPVGAPRIARCSHPRRATVARAERSSGEGSFLTGFLVGGAVFGTLGFLFAPQISKALLGEDQRLKLPRFLEDEANRDPEQTKQELIDKIAALNASIDEVAGKLKKDEPVKEAA